MAQSVSVKIDLNVSSEKIWGVFWDSANLLPKIIPSRFKIIEVIRYGNVGTINKIKYGEGMKVATHASERIEACDEKNMTVTCIVIEGEMLNIFKVLKPTLKVFPGADANSCTVSWTVEFEPEGNTTPPTEPMKEATINTFKVVEGYLLTIA